MGPGKEIITLTVNVILFPINKSLSYRHVVNSLIMWNCQKSSVHQKKDSDRQKFILCRSE